MTINLTSYQESLLIQIFASLTLSVSWLFFPKYWGDPFVVFVFNIYAILCFWLFVYYDDPYTIQEMR